MKFLNTLENSKNHLLTIFFLNPANHADGELPPIQQDLNAPHSFNFSCGLLAGDIEFEDWRDGKKYIDTTIDASSLFDGAFENSALFQDKVCDEPMHPLQMVKLSCQIAVRFCLEVTDGGITFYMERYYPKVDSLVVEYSILEVMEPTKVMKLLKHEKRVCADLSELQCAQILQRFTSSFYKDCVRKKLFNTAMAVLQEHPILHRAEIMQCVDRYNIDTIVAHMRKFDHFDPEHLKKSEDLLVMVFELLESMHSRSEYLNIYELRLFLQLDNLHEFLIRLGGGSDNFPLSEPEQKLKSYLCSLLEYNCEYGSRHGGRSKKTYEQHDYILSPIIQTINKLSQNHLWLDLSCIGRN